MPDVYPTVVCGRLKGPISDKHLTELQERVSNGVLFAEYGHPTRDLRMNYGEWISRVSTIDLNRVCARILEIKREEGDMIVVHVIPFGPMAGLVEQLSDELDVSVTFLERTILGPGGEVIRVVTYDLVPIV